MQSAHIAGSWKYYCARAFAWRDGLTVTEKIIMSLGFAGATGVSAQLRFMLPFTPIPFTGQVFAVLLSAVLLGRRYGAMSQVFYVSFGMMGVPWFAGGMAGSIFSPTAGYLIGFIPAAFFIGWMMNKSPRSHLFLFRTMILMGGVFIIYFMGALYFMGLTQSTLKQTLWLTVTPFILFDLFKSLTVSVLSLFILHK